MSMKGCKKTSAPAVVVVCAKRYLYLRFQIVADVVSRLTGYNGAEEEKREEKEEDEDKKESFLSQHLELIDIKLFALVTFFAKLGKKKFRLTLDGRMNSTAICTHTAGAKIIYDKFLENKKD